MSVRLRLKHTGTRNAKCYRIVVMDQRMSRDGRAIEEIGFYNPRSKVETVKLDRADYWIANGAQVSETVGDIIERARKGVVLADRVRKPAISKKAAAKKTPAKAKTAKADK